VWPSHGLPKIYDELQPELVMKYGPERGSIKHQQLHHASGDTWIPITSASPDI
jgi:hypothetical protein